MTNNKKVNILLSVILSGYTMGLMLLMKLIP